MAAENESCAPHGRYSDTCPSDLISIMNAFDNPDVVVNFEII